MSRLQEYRRRIGLSQRELSERADVPLRTIQQYEQKQKNINHAGALNNPGRNPSPVRRMEITNPFCWKSHFR